MTGALPDRGLAGKVVLIAGGGGIGGETAQRLAAEGCRVVLGDIALSAAQATADAIRAAGGDCTAVAYDQSDEASVRALADAAMAAYGRIDHLFANAADMVALQEDGDVLDIAMDIFDRTVAVNLRGTVLPVVDLAARLGWRPTEATHRHAIIVAQIDGQARGLIVDSVSDIVTIPDGALQPPPVTGDDAMIQFIEGLAAIDDTMVMVLALPALGTAGELAEAA